VKSVLRSLRILEAVAQHQPVSVAELSRLFDLPKSTVQRSLLTLNEAGWLRATRGDLTRWEVGARVLAVRPAALQGASLYAAARDPMRQLRDTANETIHLAVPDGLRGMVLIDRIDCHHVVRTFHEIGETSPMHATATGRAVLAHLTEAEVEEVISHGLVGYSAETITDADELRVELARIRERGYALNRDQYRPEVCAVAAAVPGADDLPVAAVSISMPNSRFDESRVPEWGELVGATAKEIGRRQAG
jgi:IclR family acetate operon transcriptional repressor